MEGDKIVCVAVDCPDPEGATKIRVSQAFIFPGFIDAHNHVAYNVFPKWTPPKLYSNRGQWQRAKEYKAFKAPYNDLKQHVFCEMVKYGEVKALISGVTTIQGTAPNNSCFRTLIRNAENQNQLGLPVDQVRTFILDVGSFKSKIDWNKTKAFVIHLAEGVDETSRAEFDTLKAKKLLQPGTVIIHGTAFGDGEFKAMGAVGAKLTWSPQSNLVLYGQTTNIPLALQYNVPVSLGVDWNPTGSDSIFDELRVAAQVNEERFGSAIPTDDWLKMVTQNPAKALALDGQIGSIAVGLKADITILRTRGDTPSASLLQTQLQDVQLVMVGGRALYGNRSAIERLRPNECESLSVHGSQKRVCVADGASAVPGGKQTLSDIQAALRARYPTLGPLAP